MSKVTIQMVHNQKDTTASYNYIIIKPQEKKQVNNLFVLPLDLRAIILITKDTLKRWKMKFCRNCGYNIVPTQVEKNASLNHCAGTPFKPRCRQLVLLLLYNGERTLQNVLAVYNLQYILIYNFIFNLTLVFYHKI